MKLKEGDQGRRISSSLELRQKAVQDIEKVWSVVEAIEVNPDIVQSVSRIGRQRSDKPRLIRLECKDVKTKRNLLSLAKNLRSTAHKEVFINPDYTMHEQEIQKKLRDELRARKELNEDVMIFRGKVIRRSEKQDF